MPSTTPLAAELVQKARDIAADAELRGMMKGAAAKHFGIENSVAYVAAMRRGAYDDDASVQAALSALREYEL